MRRRIGGLLALVALPTVGPVAAATFSASPTTGGGLSASLLVGVAALGLAVFGFVLRSDLRARFPRRQGLITSAMWLCGIVGFAFTISALTEAPVATAIPNPIPLTVDSVTAGRGVYVDSCEQCHGVSARGGGPLAYTTQIAPADLLSGHLLQHDDSDVEYWIANGLPGGMPAWQGKLTQTQIWDVVDFLRAINTGQATVAGPTPTPGPSGGSSAAPSPDPSPGS
ncbi:MAG TPA: cytochrome c [Candidatus Sulfotelmatobacter sp.]|nr:cytochrome c [Candidatus Sulfotelmatobacter sp.]